MSAMITLDASLTNAGRALVPGLDADPIPRRRRVGLKRVKRFMCFSAPVAVLDLQWTSNAARARPDTSGLPVPASRPPRSRRSVTGLRRVALGGAKAELEVELTNKVSLKMLKSRSLVDPSYPTWPRARCGCWQEMGACGIRRWG